MTGCTVHFVDEHLDHGVIILQKTVPVLESDDAHSLSKRILEQEHIAYSEAIARVLSGDYQISGRHYRLRDQAAESRNERPSDSLKDPKVLRLALDHRPAPNFSLRQGSLHFARIRQGHNNAHPVPPVRSHHRELERTLLLRTAR